MLFNSWIFAIFFIIVYGLYLLLDHKWQNRMLVVASYIFYGFWNWKFLSLLVISTILDYTCSLMIYGTENPKQRKLFVTIAITGNLSMLGFFKYYNFFAGNLQVLLQHLGLPIQLHYLNVILPIGISFYTFQTMSYSIDVYRRNLVPTRSFLDFALFVSYFPHLVAGPILRATKILPQILNPRKLNLDTFYEGCFLILWGLFQKVFVADNLAKIVNPIFASHAPYDGTKVLLGLYAFAFQILCDFNGYSDMARGLGKVMGFDIMENFREPYFSTNPQEFWRRWHISLSTWLKDYLYIPLGGSKKGTRRTYINLALTMFLGGLWHGAAWTFVFWGIYQGALLIVHRIMEPYLKMLPSPKSIFLQKVWFVVKIIFFFQFICLGWLLFRATSMTQVWQMLLALSTNFHFILDIGFIVLFTHIALLLIVHVFQYKEDDLLVVLKFKPVYQYSIYLIVLYSLILLGVTHSEEFIYFQF